MSCATDVTEQSFLYECPQCQCGIGSEREIKEKEKKMKLKVINRLSVCLPPRKNLHSTGETLKKNVISCISSNKFPGA